MLRGQQSGQAKPSPSTPLSLSSQHGSGGWSLLPAAPAAPSPNRLLGIPTSGISFSAAKGFWVRRRPNVSPAGFPGSLLQQSCLPHLEGQHEAHGHPGQPR